MKVIFIKNLRGQGKINEIKEVSDGYATNFLIKNGYAVQYTKGSLNKLNQDLKEQEDLDKKNRKEALELKKKIEKEKLSFIVKTGKEGKVFGTISSKQIHEELLKRKYKIDKKNIKIDAPISTLGSHIINITLYKDIVAFVEVKLSEK